MKMRSCCRSTANSTAWAIVAAWLTSCVWAEAQTTETATAQPATNAAAAPPAADAAAPAAEEPVDEEPLMTRSYQELREIKIGDEMVPIEENKRIRQRVMSMITNDGKFNTPDDQKVFDEYYRWRVAEMTWIENLAELPKKRDKFKRQDLSLSSKAPDLLTHSTLNAMLLNAAANIARSDIYHPVVRHNCMMLVAVLDEREPGTVSGPPPIPLPAALPVLMDTLSDAKQLECVRVAALFGIVRHTELEVAPDARKKLLPLLVSLAGSKQQGGAAGQVWMRSRAAQALGNMSAKWPEANQPTTAAALHQLIGDEQASLSARCEASHSIGTLERSVFNGNATTIGNSIGRLAVDVAKKAPVAETGRLGNDALTYAFLRLLDGLKGTESGRGLLPAATEASAKAFMQELIRRVDELASVSSDSKLQDPVRIERLGSMGDRLQDWLKKDHKLASGG